MKNEYQVIVKSNQGSTKSATHDVPQPGSWWGALKVKAIPGARYQLVDKTTGQGPDNIRVKRAGNDLHISFEGREEADLVITDYYEQTVPGFGAVIGETDPGVYYAYTPESGQTSALMGNLPDGASRIGMALGGDPVAASGAAVGALVAVAGFNPLLAAPLALLGAGGGGGGGGGATPDTTPPKISAARVAPEDDTGVSNSDGITSDNTPRLLIDADPDAVSATVTLNGKDYTSTTKNAQGQFVVQIPDTDALSNGQVTYSVVVKDAAGNPSESFPGTFVVDKSADNNYTPSEQADTNKNLPVQIISIAQDTGVSATDFITSDNTLTFKGSVANTFVTNGDFVELHLLDSTGKVVASQYVEPTNSSGQWAWAWDNSAQKLNDGTYKLTAQIVDKAGNPVGAPAAEKAITIDTNTDPDTNSNFSVAVTQLDQDIGTTGSLTPDYLTNKQNLSFHGKISSSNTDINSFTGKVLVQVLGTDGHVKSQAYVDPASNGTWSYDNTSNALGVLNANTHYVLKASIVDLAGNILKSTDQSFTVDLKNPSFSIGPSAIDNTQVTTFTSLTLTADEVGMFTNLPTLPVGQNSTTEFQAGNFSVTYTDSAGNSSTLTNGGVWKFQLSSQVLEVKPTTSAYPSKFGNGELAGSIGAYILGPDDVNLDLSTLHSTNPKVGDKVAVNHIGLSGGGVDHLANADHVLTLTTSDVLALGVKNSFVSTAAFKDHQQMRIDGDARDKVMLDDLLGGSTFEWTKAANTVELSQGQNYAVYSNASLGLDLFIQQGIVTTLL